METLLLCALGILAVKLLGPWALLPLWLWALSAAGVGR